MRLLTFTEFAKITGVSRQAVQQAVKKQKIRTIMVGKRPKIDLHDGLTMQYLKDDNVARVNSNSNTYVKTPDEKPVAPIQNEKTERPLVDEAREIKDSATTGAGTKYDYEIQRLRSITTKLNIEVAEKMGTLILRDKVETIFDSMIGVVHNYFLPIGDRVSEIVAGKLGVSDPNIMSEIKSVIDVEITRGLTKIKSEIEKGVKRG